MEAVPAAQHGATVSVLVGAVCLVIKPEDNSSGRDLFPNWTWKLKERENAHKTTVRIGLWFWLTWKNVVECFLPTSHFNILTCFKVATTEQMLLKCHSSWEVQHHFLSGSTARASRLHLASDYCAFLIWFLLSPIIFTSTIIIAIWHYYKTRLCFLSVAGRMGQIW